MTPAQAAATVRALVSGLPPERARNWHFLVLQCFVDGSGTGSPDLFVMAGYIAPAERWAEFSREWQELLNMRPALPYFKMSEIAQSPERLERASWFYRVIERHVSAAVSCVVPVPDLLKAVREAHWPAGLDLSYVENPYYFGFHAMVNGVAHEQGDWGIKDPIDFIFDEETIKKFPDGFWERMKLAATPQARAVMGNQPIYRDDIHWLPLQAADLWAWWVRKWALEGTSDGIENLKFAWDAKRRDLFRFNAPLIKQDFRDQIARMLEPRTFVIATHPNPTEALKEMDRRSQGIKMTIPDPSSFWKWGF